MNKKMTAGALTAIIIAILVVVYVTNDDNKDNYQTGEISTSSEQVVIDSEVGGQGDSKLPVGSASFAGTLDAVNTACFADGICSATVEGREVILVIGWNSETVGEVRFADRIGGLEGHVGKSVFVFAAETAEGYTLYGSEDYYIEPAI